MTGPLIDCSELAGMLGDPRLRVADTRWYLGRPEDGLRAHRAGHIPGAIYLDLERHLSATEGPGRHPLPAQEALAETLGNLGISKEHLVVAYDDRGGAVAARLWWLLRRLGHEHVAVLDGGLTAWRAAGFEETTDVVEYPVTTYQVRPGPGAVIDRDVLRSRLGTLTLLDARESERYRGESEPIDPIAGHIPGAVNVPYEENLGSDDRFLPRKKLAARYRALGAGGAGLVVAYCGSGVTACHTLLALEVAGLPLGVLYPGSWSDWATAGYAVATGPEPGEGA
jgi:thiosulfate/3-mercaptopyruvate sulfurtransferase